MVEVATYTYIKIEKHSQIIITFFLVDLKKVLSLLKRRCSEFNSQSSGFEIIIAVFRLSNDDRGIILFKIPDVLKNYRTHFAAHMSFGPYKRKSFQSSYKNFFRKRYGYKWFMYVAFFCWDRRNIFQSADRLAKYLCRENNNWILGHDVFVLRQ